MSDQSTTGKGAGCYVSTVPPTILCHIRVCTSEVRTLPVRASSRRVCLKVPSWALIHKQFNSILGLVALPLLTFNPTVQSHIYSVLHDRQELRRQQRVVAVAGTSEHSAVPELDHQAKLPQGKRLLQVTVAQSRHRLKGSGKDLRSGLMLQ